MTKKKQLERFKESGASVDKVGLSKCPTGISSFGSKTMTKKTSKAACANGGRASLKTRRIMAAALRQGIRGVQLGTLLCTLQNVLSRLLLHVDACGAISVAKKCSGLLISTKPARSKTANVFGQRGYIVDQPVARHVMSRVSLGSCRSPISAQCSRGYAIMSNGRRLSGHGVKTPFNLTPEPCAVVRSELVERSGGSGVQFLGSLRKTRPSGVTKRASNSPNRKEIVLC